AGACDGARLGNGPRAGIGAPSLQVADNPATANRGREGYRPMKTRHELPDLVRLTRLGFVNAYLVHEDDGLTLVDTMMSGSANGLIDAARTLDRPVVRIVLTHAHVDHAGSLDA